MTAPAVTNTFTNGTTADASQVNTNFTDLVTYLSQRNAGTAAWENMNVTATAANPVTIASNQSTTEVAINNTASDGDPLLTFKLSGTQTHVIGVDDSDSDFLKFGTTAITTNVAMQIPTGGAQVQFASGSAAAPAIANITDTTTGFYRSASQEIGVACGGAQAAAFFGNGFKAINGSAVNPSIVFVGGTQSGLYRSASDTIGFSSVGTAVWLYDGSGILPASDNAISCGRDGKRFTAVWAVDGTIETSHSTTKTDIVALPEDVDVPMGCFYKRAGSNRVHVGFLADNLPKEAFYGDGVSIATNAPIGVLCTVVRSLKKRVESLEQEIKWQKAK